MLHGPHVPIFLAQILCISGVKVGKPAPRLRGLACGGRRRMGDAGARFWDKQGLGVGYARELSPAERQALPQRTDPAVGHR